MGISSNFIGSSVYYLYDMMPNGRYTKWKICEYDDGKAVSRQTVEVGITEEEYFKRKLAGTL